MAARKPVKAIKPRGKALHRTQAQLDELTSSQRMAAQAPEAARDWKKNAGKGWRKLLEAKGKS